MSSIETHIVIVGIYPHFHC